MGGLFPSAVWIPPRRSERYAGQLFTYGLRNEILRRVQNIGSLAAYPIAPYLSDGIGRRATIFLGAIITLAGVAVQSASTNIGMFIAGRYVDVSTAYGLLF